jgi:hypothetical protein
MLWALSTAAAKHYKYLAQKTSNKLPNQLDIKSALLPISACDLGDRNCKPLLVPGSEGRASEGLLCGSSLFVDLGGGNFKMPLISCHERLPKDCPDDIMLQ